MKNITVSVPDEVYLRARVKAAQQSKSVSALVRQFLMTLGDEESEFERRKRLQDEIICSVQDFAATPRLNREAVHDRDALH